MRGRSNTLYRFMAWLLICTFFLPAPLAGNAAPARPSEDAQLWNRLVHERLNGPERAATLEEAAQMEAAARAQFERSQAAAQLAAAPDAASTPAAAPAAASASDVAASAPAAAPVATTAQGSRNLESFQPQSLSEILFNYAAGFMGLPGLAPRQAMGGAFDEGLGFHQDGTVRRAGGTSSGPSDNGQRARSYMQSGLQSGYGYSGLYDEMHYDLRARNQGTWAGRDGRFSEQNGDFRELSDFDPLNMAIDRGLNWGAGFMNSMGEAALSGLMDGGRARLNFRFDRDGYFSGEGDALLPFYDSARTTVYTQFGARSMHDSSDTRWIGNIGLGQRWFPLATGDDYKAAEYDAGKLMIGYNAFFDYDFSRSHQRGGIGAELWYDWLRLSSNYYFPLSGWDGSDDFDSRFVKERPAAGWDARVKAYLPFYRNVAITGAYSQWYGDRVGMFGSDRLEKDPKVWSYGIEYTPMPLFSVFVTQKNSERGRTATEFGLNFTYHFGMSWDDQTSHSTVAELRSVGGSRHEFVDRENRIILEYKARNNFRIEYLPAKSSGNTFVFRIVNGFDEFVAGQTVYISSNNNISIAAAPAAPRSFFAQVVDFLDDLISVKAAYAASAISKVTDSQGEFSVTITSPITQDVTLTAQVGDSTSSVTVPVISSVLSITTSSLPGGTANVPYPPQTVDASGGMIPYTWSASGLPNGLSIDPASGEISGTPAEGGLFNVTVAVTDSAATPATVTENFTMTVDVIALAITGPDTLPDAMVNVPYPAQAMSATGGVGAYAWSATGLPNGLWIDPASGVIDGTPTESGSFSVTVAVTDSASPTPVTVTESFPLTVDVIPLTITSQGPLPEGTGGTPYTYFLEAIGGVGAYAWFATGLPNGLWIDQSSGGIFGTPTGGGSFTVSVTVTDSASPTPTAFAQSFTLNVNVIPLTITTTTLPDATSGAPYQYFLKAIGGEGTYSWSVGGLPNGLWIDQDSGEIGGTPTEDGSFTVAVTVTDSDTGETDTQSFTLRVNVTLLEITTSSPLPSATRGTAYNHTFAATGGVEPYIWDIDSGTLPGGLTLEESGVLSGTPGESGSFTFFVKLIDSSVNPPLSTKEITLTVDPAAPDYTLPNAISIATNNSPADGNTPNMLNVRVYDRANQVNAGAGVTVSWAVDSSVNTLELLGGNTSITDDWGIAQIYVVDSSGTGTQNVSITATVDGGGADKEQTASISFQQTPNLSVSTNSVLPVATQNGPYSFSLKAMGGVAPYNWSVPANSLPDGLSLNSAGILSGTPTATGPYDFTVTVTDSNNTTASRQLTLQVNAPVSITTISPLPDGLVGLNYTQGLDATGGVAPYVWDMSSGALPDGLSMDNDGRITGIPTAEGVSDFTVRVTDSNGATAERPIILSVFLPPLSIITADPLPEAVEGVPYSLSLAAIGGEGPYTWGISAGSLPAGLSLDSGGTLSGTPTASGPYNFTVQVTDSQGTPAGQVFNLEVNGPLTIVQAPCHNAVKGAPYSHTIQGTGGLGVYSWSISDNALQLGLSIDNTGLVSGTPTESGAYTFDVTLADDLSFVTQPFTLTVDAPDPLLISTPSWSDAEEGEPFSYTLTATGGVAPYSWAVDTLPAGLSLDSSTGEISGTPTAAWTGSIVVTVTDSNALGSATGNGTFTLTVNVATMKITLTTPSPTLAASANATFTATVTLAGAPVAGEQVNFAWQTVGSNMTPIVISTRPVTDASGQTTYTFNNTGTNASHRSISVTATLASDTNTKDNATVKFGDLNNNKFIAMSNTTMNWSAANTFCTNQGGRLPKIGGESYLTSVPRGTVIESFGATGSAWPAGVPERTYWSFTRQTSGGSSGWAIKNIASELYYSTAYLSNADLHYAICVR